MDSKSLQPGATPGLPANKKNGCKKNKGQILPQTGQFFPASEEDKTLAVPKRDFAWYSIHKN